MLVVTCAESDVMYGSSSGSSWCSGIYEINDLSDPFAGRFKTEAISFRLALIEPERIGEETAGGIEIPRRQTDAVKSGKGWTFGICHESYFQRKFIRILEREDNLTKTLLRFSRRISQDLLPVLKAIPVR